MEFAVAMFPAHDAIDPAALARLVEDRGYAGLLFPKHLHIPSRRTTPPLIEAARRSHDEGGWWTLTNGSKRRRGS